MPHPPSCVPEALPPYWLELLHHSRSLIRLFPYLRKGLGFKEIPEIPVPHMAEDVDHAWHPYVIHMDLERYELDERNDRSSKETGHRNQGAFYPLHLHPNYRDNYECLPNGFPVASSVIERFISLPIYYAIYDGR